MADQRSYLGAAIRAPQNRVAAAAVVLVVGAVFAAGRAPLGTAETVELTVDLTKLGSLRSASYATPVGFVWPRPDGAASVGATPRIVFNRPLPTHFTLEIAGACTAGCEPGSFDVDVGGQRRTLSLPPTEARVMTAVDNPTGARRIELVLPPATAVRIREVRIAPAGAPS